MSHYWPREEIGWNECVCSDLFHVKLDVIHLNSFGVHGPQKMKTLLKTELRIEFVNDEVSLQSTQMQIWPLAKENDAKFKAEKIDYL